MCALQFARISLPKRDRQAYCFVRNLQVCIHAKCWLLWSWEEVWSWKQAGESAFPNRQVEIVFEDLCDF